VGGRKKELRSKRNQRLNVNCHNQFKKTFFFLFSFYLFAFLFPTFQKSYAFTPSVLVDTKNIRKTRHIFIFTFRRGYIFFPIFLVDYFDSHFCFGVG
jgi:hypothetical protein